MENYDKVLQQFTEEIKQITGNIGELENWLFRKNQADILEEKLETYYKFKMYEAITLGLLELDNLEQDQLTFYVDKLIDNQLEERFIYDTYLHKQLLPPMVKYLVKNVLDKSTSLAVLTQSWNSICENIPRAGTGLIAFLERIMVSTEKLEWFMQILGSRLYKSTEYELIIKTCLELANNEHQKNEALLHSEELVTLRTLNDVETFIRKSLQILEQHANNIADSDTKNIIINDVNQLKIDLAHSGIANILDSPTITLVN